MKTLIKVLVAGFLIISSSAHADDIANTPAYKHKSLFVLKTQKKFKGAKVEVFHASGELLTSQNLLKRKMIIDFSSVQQGTYVIEYTSKQK